MSSDFEGSLTRAIAAFDLLATKAAVAAGNDYNAQDKKFVREMIPHHEAAVEMAQKQIDKGKNADAISLAKGIKKAQAAELATMRKWLKDRDLSEEGESGGNKM